MKKFITFLFTVMIFYNGQAQKLFDAINKLGNGFQVYLNNQYFDLKRKELILDYEYQSKRQQSNS